MISITTERSDQVLISMFAPNDVQLPKLKASCPIWNYNYVD